MTLFVVDVSVVVKWFLPEKDSDKALLIRDGFVDGSYRLIAPDLMLSEFGNVLWKRRDSIEKATSLNIIGDLLNLGIPLVATEQIIVPAYKLARQHGRTVYDSLYLALAESRHCEIITADERLFNAVKRDLPFVRWLREWDPREV